MSKILIPKIKSPLFINMINALDKHHSDACISVFIDSDNSRMLLIGGAPGQYGQIEIPLEKGHGLKNAEFSIPFDFFMCMKEQQQEFNTLANQYIFELRYKNGKYINIEYCLLLRDDKKIDDSIHFPMSRFELDAAHENHIQYQVANTQRAYHELNRRSIVDIINSTNSLIPFDFVEFRKNEKEIRFQKNGEVTTKRLQDNIDLPHTLPLTEAASQTLKTLYMNSETGSIAFSLEGELLTFKTDQHTQSISLEGIEQFHRKIAQESRLLLEFASNLYDFKQLNNMILKETSVRSLNTAMLLFDSNRLFSCMLPGRREFIREVSVKHLHNHNALLFSYSPRTLKDMKLKIFAKGGEIRITLTQNQNGELKLNFFDKPEDMSPFDSLNLVSEQSQLAAYQKLKNEYLNTYDDRYILPPSRQGELDLFAEQPSDVPDEIDTPVNDIESHAQYTDTTENQTEDKLKNARVYSPTTHPDLAPKPNNKHSENITENSGDLANIDEYGFADD
ncbi:hypothetical protein [Shewanella sp. Shew256]|uniref:hypothetical protein n=1 Tax=Shewanella sp. Shew256 TaxID=1969376 RepID=UPI000B49B37F|nr:hypothetical protein [Shewanella sp. Shew256]